MEEILFAKFQKFGELTSTLERAAQQLGKPLDLFEGFREYLDRSQREGRNGQSVKTLGRVVYEVFDALKVFESRVNYSADPVVIRELADGTRSVQFRMLKKLDLSVLNLQRLFHEVLRAVLDFDLHRADSVLTQIEDFLLEMAPSLRRELEQAKRMAA